MIDLPEFDTGLYEGCELRMAGGGAVLTIFITENPSFALSFQKVRWHQFTALPNCSAEMINGSYFKLSEVSPSSDLAAFLKADQSPARAYRQLHHYRIFLDETGCHEFFAESARPVRPGATRRYTMPTIAELLLAELEREAAGTRRVLERVPEGKNDWKPHEKSMPLGYLAGLVATMPGWAAAMIDQDELDVTSAGEYQTRTWSSRSDLLRAFDTALEKARKSLAATSDEHLMTSWRMLAGGHVVSEQPRYVAIRDGAFNHLAHHRGQLTVYLRLNEVPVPSLYGPTADEKGF